MSYQRVIPRDLFNESKLLKCLGQLALHIHDGKLPKGVEFNNYKPNSNFNIFQDISGDLHCSSLVLFAGYLEIQLWIPYNSREPYPLTYESRYDGSCQDVFNSDGSLSAQFIEEVGKLCTENCKDE